MIEMSSIEQKNISLGERRFADLVFGERASVDIDRFVDEMTAGLEKEPGWSGAHDVVLSLFDERSLLSGEYRFGNVRMGIRGNAVVFEYPDDAGELQTVDATREELYGYIRAVRRRVHEQLDRRGVQGIHIKKESIAGRVHELQGGTIYKDSLANPEVAELSREALQKLYALSERSPFIRYAHVRLADNGSGLQRKLSIQTLDEALKFGKGLEVREALGFFRDFVGAALFLVRHGFRYSDLDLSNIGVDQGAKQGYAFDFDGLRLESRNGFYVSKYGYFPPERISGSYAPIDMGENEYGIPLLRPLDIQPHPVTTQEMVFELGVSLLSLVRCFSDGREARGLEAIEALAKQMMDTRPEARPSLEAVEAKIAKWIVSPEALTITYRSGPPRLSEPSPEPVRNNHHPEPVKPEDPTHKQTISVTAKTIVSTPKTVASNRHFGDVSTIEQLPKSASR